MQENYRCHQILRLASIYRRTFSVLILNVGLENIVTTNRNKKLSTKQWPGFLILLFATLIAIMSGISVYLFCKALPFTEQSVLYSVVLSHFVSFVFPMIQSMYNYRKIHFFWCKLWETTCFAISELDCDISFRYFWKCFLIDTAISIGFFALYGILRTWLYVTRIPFGIQFGITIQMGIVVYIVVHVLFIVHLNRFYIRLLIKRIKLHLRIRATNVICDDSERLLLLQLRLFKQFHYKLWEMTTAVNGFLGSTLLILSYHALIEVAYSAYYTFYYIVLRESVTELLSNFRFARISILLLCFNHLRMFHSINRTNIINLMLINFNNIINQCMPSLLPSGEFSVRFLHIFSILKQFDIFSEN